MTLGTEISGLLCLGLPFIVVLPDFAFLSLLYESRRSLFLKSRWVFVFSLPTPAPVYA